MRLAIVPAGMSSASRIARAASVPAEEAVEHLAALLRQTGEALVHSDRLGDESLTNRNMIGSLTGSHLS